MIRKALLPFIALSLAGASPIATAQEPPPAGAIENFEFIRNLGGTANITSVNVLSYGSGDVLVAVGRFGVRTFDLADPESPQALDHLTSEALRLPSDTAGTFWQSESTNVDQRRKLIFLSRDPRAYNGPQSSGVSGVYIIDAEDPSDLGLIRFHPIPAGHTSTCINGCQFLWTGGPAPDVNMPADWAGRPIFVTDVRDPENPFTYPDPVDTGRNDGVTDYAHDVQVDNEGIAWVSGRGGVRGYWTKGRHWDPLLEDHRVARAWDPIPYAGGGGPVAWKATGPAVVHNSERPVDGMPGERNGIGLKDSEHPDRPWASDGSDYEAYGFEPGELLYATHEDFNGSCPERGRFYIVSLRGSYDGQGWRSTPEDRFELEVLSSWHPWEQEGYDPATTNCSGHYFRMKDGLVYMSWYGQGTRVLDITNPYEPVQVAYFRPDGTSSYTPLLYEGLVYVADSGRGIDILRLQQDEAAAAADAGGVVAPPLPALTANLADVGYAPDPIMGWSCRVPIVQDITVG